MFEALSGSSQQKNSRRPIAILTAVGLHAAVLGGFLAAHNPVEAIVEPPPVRIIACRTCVRPAIQVELGRAGPKPKPPTTQTKPRPHKDHMTPPRSMMAEPIPDPIQPEPEALPAQPGTADNSPTSILGPGSEDGDAGDPGEGGAACPAGAVCSTMGNEQILSFSGALSRPQARCTPPAPSAPYAARQMGLDGRVVAQFIIHADGRADSVNVLNSDAPPVFAQAVREWIEQCSYEPSRLNGAPYSVRMTQVFRFETK